MAISLFLGGPEHGKWHAVPDNVQTIDWRPGRQGPPPTAQLGHSQSLKPCLELEEIKGLTGRTFHRDIPNAPPRQVAEHREIESMLTRSYRRERFILQQDVHSVFVCNDCDFKEFPLGAIVALFRTRPQGTTE